ncbi:hypothetical protein N7520_007521 [Penicillium odoratum]|uniref:uncharacterized protein n=1 Tax=Penicillium odoratum TaxID=1167516 RepID=UPI00254883E7|nr:uncharacterized protein N7520_007521 [Penicillium odoratum]KAJ5760365.1 hypothetical protein N7520_007521 [Penicillium odoratum]
MTKKKNEYCQDGWTEIIKRHTRDPRVSCLARQFFSGLQITDASSIDPFELSCILDIEQFVRHLQCLAWSFLGLVESEDAASER